jgi:Cdc6-like AAA superfamily ATPase
MMSSSSTMITNPRAFQQTYLPSELHHREGAIETLTTTLRPLTKSAAGTDVFIFGPSGTGKTTLARYVVDLIEQENPDLTSAYVNAMTNSTQADALYALSRDAGVAYDIQKEGSHASRFLSRIRGVESQFLAVIDEVHMLEDYDTLQALWESPNVTLILVSLYEERLFAEFSHQLQSRLGAVPKVHLQRYNSEEMVSILRGRLDAGARTDIIEDGVLDYIADLAAGDARAGIALLRNTIEQASANDETIVTADVVDEVIDEAYADMYAHRIQELGTDMRLLYEIIQKAGEIDAVTLHSRYETQADNPVGQSTRRKYLNRLADYNLIDTKGSGKGKRYLGT